MKDALGHGSEKGNRGRPALTNAQRYARRKKNRPTYVRDWRAANKEKVSAQSKRANELWRTRHPEQYLWHSARDHAQRHKPRPLVFRIEVADLLPLPKFCPVLHIRLEYATVSGTGRGRRPDARATVDRMDNTKGYVTGNIKIISWRANRIKNDATGDELRALAAYVTEHGV